MGFNIKNPFTKIADKVGNEFERAANRIKEDPTSALSLGISIDGNTLGYLGTAKRLGEPASEYLAEVTGAADLERQIEAEQEQAQRENDEAIQEAEQQRTTDNANRAASRGAKIRLGKPSSSLGISRSGVQV